MRSLITAALTALALSTLAPARGSAQQTPAQATTAAAPGGANAGKIAYIRSPDILASAPGRAEAEAQFQKEMTGYRAEVQRMGDSINTAIQEYGKAEPTMAGPAKAAKQKEIRDREEAYQKRTAELEQQAQQRQNELVRPIMEQINKLIEQLRGEEGYAYVLDAGSAAGVVVAADKNLDITDKVIERLKAAGPVAGTPAAAAADAAKKPAAKPSGAPTAKPAGITRPKTTPPNSR